MARKTLTQRIAENGIRVASHRWLDQHERPWWALPGTEYDVWRIELVNDSNGERFTFEQETGPGLRKMWQDGPPVRSVLADLLSTAGGWENADGYDDWRAEYGMPDDSRSHRTYEQVGKQTREVSRFLGYAYVDFMSETDPA